MVRHASLVCQPAESNHSNCKLETLSVCVMVILATMTVFGDANGYNGLTD
jgi:hypothetical protein